MKTPKTKSLKVSKKSEEDVTQPIIVSDKDNKELFADVTAKMNNFENKVLSKNFQVLTKRIEKLSKKLDEQEEILYYIASVVDGSINDNLSKEEVCADCGEKHSDSDGHQEELELEEELFQAKDADKKLNLN